MERREFLRTVALAGLASTFKFSDAMDILAQSGKNVKTGAAYDLVAVMGGEPEMMFRKAITEMGGMSKLLLNLISDGIKFRNLRGIQIRSL